MPLELSYSPLLEPRISAAKVLALCRLVQVTRIVDRQPPYASPSGSTQISLHVRPTPSGLLAAGETFWALRAMIILGFQFLHDLLSRMNIVPRDMIGMPIASSLRNPVHETQQGLGAGVVRRHSGKPRKPEYSTALGGEEEPISNQKRWTEQYFAPLLN